MALEENLRSIFADMTSVDSVSDECKRTIKNLSIELLSKDSAQLDAALNLIFHEEFGLVESIRRGWSTHRKKSHIKPLLSILTSIAKNFPEKFKGFSSQLMKLFHEHEEVKEMALDIILPILQNAPWVIQDVVQDEFFELCVRKLCLLDVKYLTLPNIRFFEVLELLLVNYPMHMSAYYSNLWRTLVSQIERLANTTGITICLSLLIKLIANFTPNKQERQELYIFMKNRLDNSSCLIHEILPQFPKLMPMFKDWIVHDYKCWHQHYLKHSNECSAKFTKEKITLPIIDFYRNISEIKLVDTQSMNEDFTAYLISCLSSSDSNQLKEFDSEFLILWSERLPHFATESRLEEFLEALVRYIFAEFLVSSAVKTSIQSNCIQGACILLGKKPNLFIKHRRIVLNFLNLLVDSYSDERDDVINSMRVSILNVPPSEKQLLKEFVYTTLVKHCSKKWLIHGCTNTRCACFLNPKFWLGLLDEKMYCSNITPDLVDHPNDMVQSTITSIWNFIWETVFDLSRTLNFHLLNQVSSQDDIKIRISREKRFLASSSGDITLFTNLVSLVEYLSPKMLLNVSLLWKDYILQESIQLSLDSPFISSFYRLIVVRLNMKSRTNDSLNTKTSLESILFEFIPVCLKNCQVFSGDLLTSNIDVILNSPAELVVRFERDLLEFLKVAHQCALHDSQLAIRFVRALNQWNRLGGNDEITSIILQSIASLASLPKLQIGFKSKVPRFKENRSLFHEIYTLLAQVDRDTLKLFYSSFRQDGQFRGNVNLKLSSQDLQFDINIVHLLPQAVLLANQSSFPAVRLHSVELLHFIAIYVIGKSSYLEDVDNDCLAECFQKIVFTCLALSNDSILEIRKISRSLLVQCSNLFSHKMMMKELNKGFIDCLFDFIVLSKCEEGLKLCCDCFCTLVKAEEDSDDLTKQNHEVIMNRVFHNLLHPSLAIRRGGCLTLSAIKEAVFNQLWSYDKYCLYLIYLAISSLSMYQDGHEYVIEILKDVRNAIISNPQVLLKKSYTRLSAPCLVDVDLNDMFTWLRQQAVNTQPLVTKECIDILSCLSDSIPDFCPSNQPVSDFTTTTFQVFTDLSEQIDAIDLNKMLSAKLTCHILFVKWLLGYHPPTFLTSEEKVFFRVIGKVMQKLILSESRNVSSNLAKHYEDKDAREEFIFAVLDLIISVHNMDILLFEEIFQYLVSQYQFDQLVTRFLIEPSSLGVRITEQHERTCEKVWGIFKSNETITNLVLSLFFTKILNSLVELPKVIHHESVLSDSSVQLLHFICLPEIQSFLSEKCEKEVSNWLRTFFQAFECENSCNHLAAHADSRCITKLLQFILSSSSLEKVCLELFHYIDSGLTGILFYSRFESTLQKFILENVKEYHCNCFGNLDSKNKITILCRLLTKTYSCSPTKLSDTVINILKLQWLRLSDWAQQNEDNYHLFLDFLYFLGSAVGSPSGIFHGTDIACFINETARSNHPTYKHQLLAPFTDSNLRTTLMRIDSQDQWKIDRSLQIVLGYSLIYGNTNVVPYCLKELSKSRNAFLEACNLITPRVSCLNSLCQESLLECVFSIVMENCTAETAGICDGFLQLLEESSLTSQIQFYFNNGSIIKETFFQENVLSDSGQLSRVSLSFILVGKICGLFSSSGFKEDGFITRTLGNRRNLIKRCYSFQRCSPVSDANDDYLSLWRKAQCVALNCLLVLLCNGDLNGKMLQHFIFQDKKEGWPCVFESILNQSTPLRFVTWQEIRERKNRQKKIVITGIKLTSRPSGFHPYSSYLSVSSNSLSQECKVYDFIGNPDVPSLEHLSSSTQVDLENDSLDCHECLPYLCHAIMKTVELAITPASAGQEMPDWMKSFNVLLRNPNLSSNAKTLIVKVFYKCRDIFEPYAASFWAHPILFALSIGCCGEATSHFFQQVVKMLTSWEIDVKPGDNHQKGWCKIIESILVSSMKCDSRDRNRLLDILRLVVETKKTAITPPSALLFHLASSTSVEVVELALEGSIIFLSNGVNPFVNTDEDEVFDLLKGYLASKELCDIAARAIGSLLNIASGDQQQKYLALVREKLQHKQKETLVSLLKHISVFFPQISESYIDILLSYLENKKLKTIHYNCVSIIKCYASRFPSRKLFDNLQSHNFFDLSTGKLIATSVKNVIPEIIKCFINCGDSTVLQSVLNLVKKNVEAFNQLGKLSAYEIFIQALHFLNMEDSLNSNQFENNRRWLVKRLFALKINTKEKLIGLMVDNGIFNDGPQRMFMTLLDCACECESLDPVQCIVNIILRKQLSFYRKGEEIFDGPIIRDTSKPGESELNLLKAVDKFVSAAPLFVETLEYEVPPVPDFEDPISKPDLSKEEQRDHADKNWKNAKSPLGIMAFIRSYKFGKFPDVQTSYQETVDLLIWLSQTNGPLANKMFVLLFASAFRGTLDAAGLVYFKKLVPRYLNSLLKKPKTNATLLKIFLNVCWKNEILLDPVVVYDVCQVYHLEEIGILLNEFNIQRTTVSPWNFPSEADWSTDSQYFYGLSMFYDALGSQQISENVLRILPNEIRSLERKNYSGTDVAKMDNLQDIYWVNKGMKEMALLGKWDQLYNQFSDWNSSIPGSVMEQRWWRRHLQIQMLSELNKSILDMNEDKVCPHWLLQDKDEKKMMMEQEFSEDLNVLFLSHNLAEKFQQKANVSLNYWTSYLALEGKLSGVQLETKTKKLLDNYVMSDAIGDEKGESLRILHETDIPTFPEDLIQWHQLLINRDYFVRFMDRGGALKDNDGTQITLQSTTSDFLSCLIVYQQLTTPGISSLDGIKQSYHLNSMDGFMISMNEYNYSNDPSKFHIFWKAWDLLVGGLTGNDSSNPRILKNMSDLCSETIHLIKAADGFDSSELRKRLKILSVTEGTSGLIDTVIFYGLDSLLKASSFTKVDKQSSALMNTAEYCMKHISDSSALLRNVLEKNTVECIMKSLVLGSSSGVHLLLIAIDIVLRNPSLVGLFQSECPKVELSLFVFWLPQLVGYLTVENAVVLEPLFERLAMKFPQKLILLLKLNKNHLSSIPMVWKLMNQLSSQSACEKFVEALGTLCHPNTLLKSHLSRLMKAQTDGEISSVYQEIQEKCFYNPSRGCMVGRLYSKNNKYEDLVENIHGMKKNGHQFSKQEFEEHLRKIEQEELNENIQLESFCPFLSMFDCRVFNFELAYSNSHKNCTLSNTISLISFLPSVTVIKSMRHPMKIKMLGSDGRIYSWIVKYGDDLRQDQYIQQLFSVINTSLKKARDWENEAISTYRVEPLTPHFGMIEVLNSTATLSQLLNAQSTFVINLRAILSHESKMNSVQPLESTSIRASFSRENEIRSFVNKMSRVPRDLLRTVILNYCETPEEYFCKRLNFLRSHSVMSIAHWILGVGDRHLNNFLFSTSTCEIIGIDFGRSFGAGTEILLVPDLVPFRLTPQFCNLYSFIYKKGILQNTMVKCFNAFDKKLLVLALKVIETLPPDVLSYELESKDSIKNHAQRIIQIVERKLKGENPVKIVQEHLNRGKLSEAVKKFYVSCVENFPLSPGIMSPTDLVEVLMNMASDSLLLSLSHHGYEPWI